MTFGRVKIFKFLFLIFLFCFCTYIFLFIYEKHERNNIIEFSYESGFYDSPIYLDIIGQKGSTIYYTLDCSSPTEESIRYTEPIYIEDASTHSNVYSIISDVSPLLDKELLELKAVPDYGYCLPDELVDKATVVRAASVDRYGNWSEVYTRVFFVGLGAKNGYDEISIVSIVTEPDALFDYEKGIYVSGVDYDLFLATKDVLSKYDYADWAGGNYRRRGKKGRCDADIIIWGTDNSELLSERVKISLQGGGARAWIPKNFNIYRDGANTDEFLQSINLSSGGQDRYAKIRNRLVNELTTGFDISVRSYRPCVLFLEGEYWGTYHLTERFDESYFQDKYNVLEDEIVMIKVGKVELGRKNDIDLYEDMLTTVSSLDLSDNDNYHLACELIDMQSLIDYYAIQIYISNTDWPGANYALWRTRNNLSAGYGDAKWRFILYDLDETMRFSTYDGVKHAIEKDSVFANLMNNEIFSNSFENRLVFLAESVFEPQIIEEYINEYEVEMSSAIELEYKRYYGENKEVGDFYKNCEQIKKFFRDRYDYIMQKYKEEI